MAAINSTTAWDECVVEKSIANDEMRSKSGEISQHSTKKSGNK